MKEAGLFSAVVTAFTIESYQWLQEAPEDTTVVLLKRISQQLNNTSVSQSEPDEFTIASSVVAINVLWFLSLIIALVDALFALLCKQWLREHRRHTHTRAPSEALALRWLRNQSLEKWRVPTILASLPMLLELALFLFLAGLLELLRTRHPVPFAIATIVVAFATLFYFGTTIIPAVDIVRQALQVTSNLRSMQTQLPELFNFDSAVQSIRELPPMEYTCPYKSPQAWAAFQSLRLFSPILGHLNRVVRFLWTRDYISLSTLQDLRHLTQALGEPIDALLNWSTVDLELLRRSGVHLAPPFYELNAFRWLVAELRDSPHMIPHLQNILSAIPLHLVMPAVLDQWFFLPGRKWTVGDIETAIAPNLPPRGIEGHLTYAKRQFLPQGRETPLFNYLLHWIHVSMNRGDERTDSGRDSQDLFPGPFRGVDANPDNNSARLWDIYVELVQNPAASDFYWATLTEDLASYIIASSLDYALHVPTATTISPFVESGDGCEFLFKAHSNILGRGIYGFSAPRDKGILDWIEAMDIVRCVHDFPGNHFQPIPGHFSLPLSKLRKTLNSLSPTDPDNDFRYLDGFRRGWGDANEENRLHLVEILSEHINNYPQCDAEPSHSPDNKLNISPLVMSPAGLELIAFVNDRLAEDSEVRGLLPYFSRRRYTTQWRDAVERVKMARPELPQDHFENISHEGVDSPVSDEHQSQQEVEVRAQAGESRSSGFPRDVTNAGEANRDEANRRTNLAAEPSPQPDSEPGELDERDALVDGDTDGREDMSSQLAVTGDPAAVSGTISSPVRGKMVGGPDADKNV
ncbi:hypothetical protein AAF712_012806 [Marasmius tenuissimus]|uniref:DUF6535 domain-containing protein n=1 Tax=Marasmius tenuissimus TaxID=585030 RepID=A0ABR2ZFL0_9AGAR